MTQKRNCKLVLEDGQEFCGVGFGGRTPAAGELVFNTSMVGYTEVISDPSMLGKIVVMTYPLMGQYGITKEDMESRMPGLAGLVVRETCDTPSNFRYTHTLGETLEETEVPAISGLDTRMLTAIIRDKGNMKAAIVDGDCSKDEALALIASYSDCSCAAAEVSCSKRWFARVANHRSDVVILDLGVKQSVIRALTRRGCNVTVLPYNSSAEEILAFNPDGVLISSGPGNPEDLRKIVDVINALKGKLPVYGTGLGHELICMSYGAKTEKLHCGRYGDAPVRDTRSGKIVTAMHTHSYSVNRDSLNGCGLELIFESITDNIVEGVCCAADRVCSVQFCPEGGPGPEETDFFDRFVKEMED